MKNPTRIEQRGYRNDLIIYVAGARRITNFGLGNNAKLRVGMIGAGSWASRGIVVSISMPNNMHYDSSIAAIEAGKHVTARSRLR